MDTEQAQKLRRAFPAHGEKVHVVTEFINGDHDAKSIAKPWVANAPENPDTLRRYQKCFDDLEAVLFEGKNRIIELASRRHSGVVVTV